MSSNKHRHWFDTSTAMFIGSSKVGNVLNKFYITEKRTVFMTKETNGITGLVYVSANRRDLKMHRITVPKELIFNKATDSIDVNDYKLITYTLFGIILFSALFASYWIYRVNEYSSSVVD